jgi:predicted nucleic acid-binding Zn ribbon protein
MSEFASVTPTESVPGVIAYECRECGYMTSVLQPPTEDAEE